MINLPKRETKLLVAIHGWSGIVLGLVLYAVVLTGMTAVFGVEIGTWSTGAVDARPALTRPLDADLRRLAAQTPAQFKDSVTLFATADNHTDAFFHHDTKDASGNPTEEGVLYELDRDGRTVSTRRGFSDDVFGPKNADALQRFLIDTHVRLHIPNPWGLLLTGVLGLAMLVAAISGLLIHRHLLKDMFTLRREGQRVLAARDVHSVAGTWSLPFAFALAFTGSFLSFSGSIGFPALAKVAFGGDQQRMFEVLVGAPSASDPSPAAGSSIDLIFADSARRAGVAPRFAEIAQWGRGDARVTTTHEPREGGLEQVTLLYDGASGAFLREKPQLGAKPSIGNALFSVMVPLHFGDFAGPLSKAVWVGLGFAMCYVTLTGMRLWLRRREDDSPALERLDRATTVVGFGLPLALIASAWGYFLAEPAGTAVWWTPGGFLIAAAGAIIAGLVLREPPLSLLLRALTGIGLLALPLLRLLADGPGWGEAIASAQPIIVSLDIAVALAGAAMLLSLRRKTVPASRPTRRMAVLEPAE